MLVFRDVESKILHSPFPRTVVNSVITQWINLQAQTCGLHRNARIACSLPSEISGVLDSFSTMLSCSLPMSVIDEIGNLTFLSLLLRVELRWLWFSHWVVSDSLWPMDCSLPDFSVHGILQARILEWVAVSFSRGSSQPGDRTQVSRIAGGFFTTWATREAHSARL